MLIALFSLFLSIASAKPIVIAVLDTGLSYNQHSAQAKLCQYGHKDFTEEKDFESRFDTKDAVPRDVHGHGTNVAGIINTTANNTGKEFCLVILKVFTFKSRISQISSSNEAIRHARRIGADVINYSAGGFAADKEEAQEIKLFIDNGGIFVAAAGNEKSDLSKIPYYPACAHPDIIVVGNLNKDFTRTESSNYGKQIKRWEYGNLVWGFGNSASGTSQAAAVASGKIIAEPKINMIKQIKELNVSE